MHRTRTTLAVAAMVVATAVGGCGSDKDPKAKAPVEPTTPAQPTVDPSTVDQPSLAWAKKFCGQLSAALKPITPPNMQSTTPADQQAAIVTFFGTVVDQQAKQLEAFQQIGPPPGAAAQARFEKAQAELKRVRKAIAKLTKQLEGEKPKTAKDLQDMLAGLRKQMTVLSSFQGPVAELQKDKKLGPALAAVPACQATR